MDVKVGIIMGSVSDWDTMAHASETLHELGIPHETRVVSAHRTPDLLFEYCGTAAERRRTLCVADVHAFEGHIACDPDSRAEVVVPLLRDGEVYGVLDVDSPEPDRFTPDDVARLEAAAALLSAHLGAAAGKL